MYSGTVGSGAGHSCSFTDSTGRNRLALAPGDWDIRADIGGIATGWSLPNWNAESSKFSKIATVRVPDHGKITLNLVVSKIEFYSFDKDSQGDPKDQCAPERVRVRSWDRFSEDARRMGLSKANYESHVGFGFEPGIQPKIGGTPDPVLRRYEVSLACAEKWLGASFSDGSNGGCSELASLHEKIEDLYWLASLTYANLPPQNYALALEWARKGAAAGYVRSMNDLGGYHRLGIVTERNDEEAFKWLKIASEGGCRPVMRLVGRMYQNGEGTQRDVMQAAFWATLSGSATPSGLSRADFAQAQELATQWRPSKGTKGTCIDPAASASSTGASSLPIQLHPTGTVGLNPKLTIVNDSALNWQVALAGPSNYTISITSYGSQTITLTPGTYYISGRTDGAHVIPFAPASYTFPEDVAGTLTITVR